MVRSKIRVYIGGLVARRHTNDTHHPGSCYHEKPSRCRHLRRTQNVAAEVEGDPGVRPGLVYVPNQHGSDEKSNGIPGRSR